MSSHVGKYERNAGESDDVVICEFAQNLNIQAGTVMKLDDLNLFRMVVDNGSYTAASRKTQVPVANNTDTMHEEQAPCKSTTCEIWLL